jgi:hypothetical protein
MPIARIRPMPFFAALTLAAVLAGCHSRTAPTPENFTAALNAHFLEHRECLFPDDPHFPVEAGAAGDPAKKQQLDALAAAQLLTVSEEKSLHVSRYVTTPMGETVAPHFCYGHRAVSSIDSSTPPAPANGFTETQVAYHYTMEDVPVWAKSAQMRAAFPALAHAVSGSATGKATLAGTMAGWQVPD